MPDRKQTPDIISELMAGDSKPAKQNAGIPVKQQTSRPAKKQAGKRGHVIDFATGQVEKPIKATFYLSPGAVETLEAVWMERRHKASPQERGRISKSLLVEEAIGLLKKKQA